MRLSRKKYMGTICLSGIAIGISLFTFNEIIPKAHHEKKLDKILTLGSKDAPTLSQARQTRKNGKKELHHTQSNKKIELRYDTSILTLDKEVSKSSLNEKLEGVSLILGEEGVLTVMDANKASIVFDTGEIIAEDVLLKKNDGQEELFQGTAKKIRGNIIGSTGSMATEMKGDVTFKTPFGRIQADFAEISGDPNKLSKEGVFNFSQNVVIELTKGETIFCDKASLNSNDEGINGECLGLINPVKFKSLKTSVSCQKVLFSRSDSTQKVQGVGDVLIGMDSGMTAAGDVLEIFNSKEDNRYELISNADRKCTFKAPFGLNINSPKITFSENEGSILFQDPKGECLTNKQTLEFSSDFLTWMLSKKQMVLDGKSIIKLPQASWQVDGQVNLFFGKTLDHGMPEKIEADGNMLFSNIKRGMTLSSLGKALYTASEHRFTIEKEGSAKQIHIVDHLGQIFSDRAVFILNPLLGNLEVETVNLFGNLKFINKIFSSREQEALQFILADEVNIALGTQEAHFKADQGKRVLIMDKINRMQVSAPSITVKRGEGLSPFSIKGGGDVRFSFKEEELAEIKQRFKGIR